MIFGNHKCTWKRVLNSSRRIALCTSAMLIAATLSTITPASADEEEAPHLQAARYLLTGLKACQVFEGRKIRVAFVGFHPTDGSLGEEHATAIREQIEGHLSRLIQEKNRPYNLIPIHDEGRMIEILSEAGVVRKLERISDKPAEAPFDLVIFAKGRRVAEEFSAVFSVHRRGDPCRHSSTRIRFEIGPIAVKLLEKAMQESIFDFFRFARDIGKIVIQRTQLDGNPASRRMVRTLEETFENQLIKGVRGNLQSFGDDKSVRIGTFETLLVGDGDRNDVWSAQLILKTTAEDTNIIRMTVKFEHIKHSSYGQTHSIAYKEIFRGPIDKAFELITNKNGIRSGSRLKFRFRMFKPAKLYCLLRMNSGNSLVVYPTLRTFEDDLSHTIHHFEPREKVYTFPSRRVAGFHKFRLKKIATHHLYCLAAGRRINDELHEYWIAQSPLRRLGRSDSDGKRLSAALSGQATLEMLNRFRRNRHVEEQTLAIRIVEKD